MNIRSNMLDKNLIVLYYLQFSCPRRVRERWRALSEPTTKGGIVFERIKKFWAWLCEPAPVVPKIPRTFCPKGCQVSECDRHRNFERVRAANPDVAEEDLRCDMFNPRW